MRLAIPLPPPIGSRKATPARVAVAALACAVAGLMGASLSEIAAMLALFAGLAAASERQHGAMLLAAGIAAGLAPTGLLLTPFFLGVAIRGRAICGVPVALVSAALLGSLVTWRLPVVAALNLWGLSSSFPHVETLVIPLTVGVAAWLTARSASMTSDRVSEARFGATLLAFALPLPIGALAVIAASWLVRTPRVSRNPAANDNPESPGRLRLAA